MAPDLNTIPPPPRNSNTSQASGPQHTSGAATMSPSRHSSTPASRRASQIYPMSPPPLPLASPGGTIPHAQQSTHAFPPLSPGLLGHSHHVDSSGVPMRHPRPLTAAELHLELEKEQEAVVNRLTRELSALRAHSASVASTTSSTTSNLLDSDPSLTHTSLTGPTHPTSARRHRSSSSVSRTSTSTFPHRYSLSSQPPSAAEYRAIGIVSTPRYEEVVQYRLELEEARRENEGLKRRVRELERLVREDGHRGRRGDGAGAGAGA